MRNPLSVVVVIMVSLGCHQPQLTDVRDDAEKVIEGARIRADQLRELSAEELQELWAIEYATVRVAGGNLETVEAVLNDMGRERWDCFQIAQHEDGQVFYFKRNRSNLSAYLTNLLRVGALAF